jgi:hypothetical protein
MFFDHYTAPRDDALRALTMLACAVDARGRAHEAYAWRQIAEHAADVARAHPARLCPSCCGDGHGDDDGRCEQCAGHGLLTPSGAIWRADDVRAV